MSFVHTAGVRQYRFAELRTLLARATSLRSGDQLAGVAAADAQERVAAQMVAAHHGCDQQTIDARAHAVARRFEPLLANTVVGFIGLEYLFDGKQIIRAGPEDRFCGKLPGLPMGCDICHTNHAQAGSDDMDALLVLLGAAGRSCAVDLGPAGHP
jgi:ethanolamine ammonia-lyase large subunit